MRALKVEISGTLFLDLVGIDAKAITAYAACVERYDTLSVVFAGDDPRLPEVQPGAPWPEGTIECTVVEGKTRSAPEGKFVVFEKGEKP